jgi:hypothetical protein
MTPSPAANWSLASNLPKDSGTVRYNSALVTAPAVVVRVEVTPRAMGRTKERSDLDM